jgi:hypothetical protein
MQRHIFYVQSRNAQTGDGTKENPYGSLLYAKEKLQEKLPSLKGEVILELDGGRYELNEPLTFTFADGGAENKKVIYRAAAGQKAVLSGGRKVVGWEDCGNGIWKANAYRAFEFYGGECGGGRKRIRNRFASHQNDVVYRRRAQGQSEGGRVVWGVEKGRRTYFPLYVRLAGNDYAPYNGNQKDNIKE